MKYNYIGNNCFGCISISVVQFVRDIKILPHISAETVIFFHDDPVKKLFYICAAARKSVITIRKYSPQRCILADSELLSLSATERRTWTVFELFRKFLCFIHAVGISDLNPDAIDVIFSCFVVRFLNIFSLVDLCL